MEEECRQAPILQKESRETVFRSLSRTCKITADTVHSADTDSKVLITSIKGGFIYLSVSEKIIIKFYANVDNEEVRMSCHCTSTMKLK